MRGSSTSVAAGMSVSPASPRSPSACACVRRDPHARAPAAPPPPPDPRTQTRVTPRPASPRGRYSEARRNAVASRESQHNASGASSNSGDGEDPADPGGLSVLRASTGLYATKRFSLGRNGKLRKSSYGNAKWFSVTPVTIDGIDELAAMLDRLQHDPHAFVVRGALRPDADPQRTRRLLHDDPEDKHPATFRSAARQWLDIDFDGIPAPITIDPVDDPEGAIEYLIGLLPPEFQDATCWWQWTSSQGFKPDTLNARIWFWLDRPIPDEDLIRWAKAVNKAAGRKLIDDALYRVVQPHYVAAP